MSSPSASTQTSDWKCAPSINHPLPMNGAKTLFLLFVVHALSGSFGLMAREPENKQGVAAAIEAFRRMDEWDIQSFRIPVGYSFLRRGSLEDAALGSPSERIKSALAEQVGDLPEGTIIELDLESGTLAVRSTNEALQRIGQFCNQLCSGLPQIISMKLEVFETAAAVEESQLASLLEHQDHEAYASALRKQVANGDAKLLDQVQCQGKLGGRLVLASGKEGTEPQLKLEVDTTLLPENIVTLNLHLEVGHTSAEASPGRTFRNEETVITGTAVKSSTSRVIGMWKPWGMEKDLTRIAILKVQVNPLLPEKNHALEAQLRERQGITTATPPPELRVPEGMELRAFHCHVNLFYLWSMSRPPGGVPSDPFETAKQPDVVGKSPSPIRSIQEGLAQQGLQFPEGSKVYWHWESRMLVVVNTPDNIDQIEAFTETFCGVCPSILVHELLAVEGNRALMQPLDARADGSTDHSWSWKQAQALLAKGELKRVSFLRAESNSGQRMSVFSGNTRDDASEKEQGKPSSNPEDAADEGDKKDEEEIASCGIGALLEADTILGPDGYTIEAMLNFTQHHISKNLDAAGSKPAQSIFTSTTLARGIPRLLLLRKVSDGPTHEKDIMQAVFVRVSRYDVNP